MTKIKEIPSKEILEKYLYINNLHELIWKYRPIELCKTIGNFKLFNRKFAGKKAGCDMRNGYLAVSINGERYKSHRIIYQLTHGNVNEFTHIDHADGNTFNNNPSNLRQSNQPSLSRNRLPSSPAIEPLGRLVQESHPATLCPWTHRHHGDGPRGQRSCRERQS